MAPQNKNALEKSSDVKELDLSPVLESARLFLESDDVDFITSSLLLAVMGKFLVSRSIIFLYESDSKKHRVYKFKGTNNAKLNQAVDISFQSDHDQTQCICLTKEQSVGPLSGLSYLFNLKSAGKHLGYIGLGSRFNLEPFKENEIDFINALAALGAISLANARLIERLKKTNRTLDRKNYELNTLFDLSKQFNELEGRESIADMLKFTIMGHVFVRRFFFIYRPSVDADTYHCISKNGFDEEIVHERIAVIFNQEFEGDVVNVKDYEELAFLEEMFIQKLVILHFQNDKLGIIGIGAKANGTPYIKAEESLIHSMSNLALLSIQKVSLLEQKIEKERIEEELNLAKGIQQGLLPSEMPTFDNFEIAGYNVPSKQVGGDYYDIICRENDEIFCAIADVTGKGFPASLLMSNLQAAMHTVVEYDADLASATARLNDTIYKNTPSDKFITFFWFKLNTATKEVIYVNAGHNPPYLYKSKTNELIELNDGGILLGALPTMMPYQQGSFSMEKGDMIVSFTDGVTEAFDENREEYGEERLKKLILDNYSKKASVLTDKIVQHVMKFANGIQYDDITILVLKAI